MNAITCCPGCATRFRVAPEQLQISNGWVRCGNCNLVFNAGESLHPEDASTAQPFAAPLADAHNPEAARPGTAAPAVSTDRTDHTGNAPVRPSERWLSDLQETFLPSDKGRDTLSPPPAWLAGEQAAQHNARPLSSHPEAAAGPLTFHRQERAAGPYVPAGATLRTSATAGTGTAAAEQQPHYPTRRSVPASAPAPGTPAPVPAGPAWPAPGDADAMPPESSTDAAVQAEIERWLSMPQDAAAEHAAGAAAAARITPDDIVGASATPPERSAGAQARAAGSPAADTSPAAPHTAEHGHAAQPLPQQHPGAIAPLRQESKEPGAPARAAASQPWAAHAPQPPAAVRERPGVSTSPVHGSFDTTRELGFVRAAGRNAFWKRSGVRAAGVSLLLLLALTLALQLLLLQRDSIAARNPAMNARMQGLCALLGCEVRPLQAIDRLALEGSNFQALGQDLFTLSWTVRNRGSHWLLTPDLLLTLRNDAGDALIRREMTPAQLHGPPQLAPGQTWQGSQSFEAGTEAGAISAYQVQIHYPDTR